MKKESRKDKADKVKIAWDAISNHLRWFGRTVGVCQGLIDGMRDALIDQIISWVQTKSGSKSPDEVATCSFIAGLTASQNHGGTRSCRKIDNSKSWRSKI